MPIVQPVYGPQYGEIIRDALGVYGSIKGIQQRDKELEAKRSAQKAEQERQQKIQQLTQEAMTNPVAFNELVGLDPGRAESIQKISGVNMKRFFKERADTALEIKDLPKEKKLLILDQRIQKLTTEGRDPSNTMRLREMIAKDDPTAEQTLSNVLEQSYQAGILTRPPQQKGTYRIASEQEKIKAGVDPKKPFQISPKGQFMQIGSKGQTINVGTGDASGKVFAEELAKSQIAYRDKVIERAETAEGQNQTLMEMKNTDVQQGMLEPMKNWFGALGESLGIDMSSLANVPAGQVYNAKAKSLVLAEMQKQKGPQTESDMKLIRQTVAGLGQSPEANKFLIESAIAQNKRKIEERDFLDNWLHDKGNLDDARKAWNDYKKKVPMIGRYAKQGGLPMFYHQFEEMALEADPTLSREQIIESWKEAEKAAKEAIEKGKPKYKAIESAKPISTMMNDRQPSTYQSEIPDRPNMNPVRDTSSGRYGL